MISEQHIWHIIYSTVLEQKHRYWTHNTYTSLQNQWEWDSYRNLQYISLCLSVHVCHNFFINSEVIQSDYNKLVWISTEKIYKMFFLCTSNVHNGQVTAVCSGKFIFSDHNRPQIMTVTHKAKITECARHCSAGALCCKNSTKCALLIMNNADLVLQNERQRTFTHHNIRIQNQSTVACQAASAESMPKLHAVQ